VDQSASRCCLSCRAGRGISEGRGPYVYLSRGLGPLWGFLFGQDELASRAASGYGHAGDRVRAILGIPVSYRGHAFIHNPPRRLGVHPSTRPNTGGFDGGGRYGYELLQCADEWRDLGSTYVQKWTPGTGTYAVNPDCAGAAVLHTPVNPEVKLHFLVVKHGTENPPSGRRKCSHRPLRQSRVLGARSQWLTCRRAEEFIKKKFVRAWSAALGIHEIASKQKLVS